ncbi:Oligopeptide ABC transporter, periplasmic oligopeptide-binding protein OppA [Streptococcus oralis]|uniref:Oligopeptide ABC transporter, periplasmic oligopeptide-binding protein OppA n=1 Tax=Streptococcus oralis TaxID=1303 RepID=A0A139RPK2_STROR|nr:peptide ABC transporter substrate-binding protein [Streptococcus oralis]KXU16687.1 Oligopeptide ABC transporter, periplasmic oligopeptide-binding protein OppA [Streptococcus oralis]
MKKSRVFVAAGVALLATSVLAACGASKSSDSTAPKAYGYVYTSDPETLDYIVSGKQSTKAVTSNGIDGLFTNDKYGNLTPAVAEDWSVSQDGLTYTYKIRKGVKWFTSDGEEYAEVTAKDFVNGLKHAADKKSEALYLAQDSVKGLSDYLSGASADFSTVGIKAVDDYTLQYTLNQAEPFWNSKLVYSIFWPLNEEFETSKGADFAKSTDPTSLLYNGPFLLKALTAKSSVEFAKNEQYWDKDNVHLDTITLAYYDGSDQESLERNFTSGAYSYARLFPTSSNYSKVEEDYKDNIYYTQPGSGIAGLGVNIDRQNYNYTSKTTDAEKTSTKKALLNKDFRQALNFALDRSTYSAQVNGKDGAVRAVRNLFVKPDFVSAGEKTFGDLVADKMTAYGDEWKGVSFADGQDGLFDADKAKAEFAKAKKALEAEGVTFPIHLDVPMDQTSKNFIARMQSFKQSIENVLGTENVIIDLQQMTSDELLNITYYAGSAAAEDWDLSGAVGWNPDFEDPSTYLDILKTTNSTQTKTYMGYDDPNNAAASQVGLKEYDKLVDEAGAETSNLNVRYEKYAAAQAWLTDSSLFIPTMMANGAAPVISRVVPFTSAYAQAGDKGADIYFKYIELQDKPVTKKEYDQAREKWLKEKKESNEKVQKELANHVK